MARSISIKKAIIVSGRRSQKKPTPKKTAKAVGVSSSKRTMTRKIKWDPAAHPRHVTGRFKNK